MSDKLLDEHKARHKLPGQYQGMDDVLDHVAIRKARPRPKDVIETARRLPGTKVRVKKDGSFTVSASDLKAKLELAHMFDGARKLQAERAEKVRARAEKMAARGRNGRVVEIHANNERELVRAGALTAMRPILTPPGGLPRCQIEGGEHELRDGTRCWWCGQQMIEEADQCH